MTTPDLEAAPDGAPESSGPPACLHRRRRGEIRRWKGAPEPYLHVADLLESAELPGTATSVAEDPGGHVVAVFQAVPEDDAKRSVALLVHPGRRGEGLGEASLLAAPDEPCYADSELQVVIDRDNVASLRCFRRCGFEADGDESPRYRRLTHTGRARP